MGIDALNSARTRKTHELLRGTCRMDQPGDKTLCGVFWIPKAWHLFPEVWNTIMVSEQGPRKHGVPRSPQGG